MKEDSRRMPVIKKLLCIFIFSVTLIMSCSKENKNKIKPDTVPVDKNASDGVKKLMNYFYDEVYGKHIISGIMDCAWSNKIDMKKKVVLDTGKEPALMGYDFMNLTKKGGLEEFNPSQVQKAIDWWKKGGLVTFTWHWRDPSDSSRYPEFYTEKTDFTIPYDKDKKALDTESKDFEFIKKDLDTIASYLDELQKNGVVVLWRPMHEGAGNYGLYGGQGKAWFWWGARGPEPYVALYRFMFDYFTNEKKLHNLIWVWNGQHKQFYPGDDYVDIIGWDPYKNTHSSMDSLYEKCISMSDNPEERQKMIAISENDCVPDPDEFKKSDSNWIFFMIWNDDDALMDDSQDDDDNFWGGRKFNSLEDKKKCFTSSYVITRESLNLEKILK